MGRWPPTIQPGVIELVDEQQPLIMVGEPSWYEWLATASKFVFVGDKGTFTAYEAQQLETDPNTPANAPYSIISQLNAFSSTEGYWTTIGSYGTIPGVVQILSTVPVVGGILADLFAVSCDEVDISSALVPSGTTVSPGPSLASAQVILRSVYFS